MPGLRAPYQAFADACRAQVDALVTDALQFAELEFTVPTDMALDLLMAAHDHMQQTALFTDRLDPRRHARADHEPDTTAQPVTFPALVDNL